MNGWSLKSGLKRVVAPLAVVLLAFIPQALGNIQIYRSGQTGATTDEQGNVIWFPQTIVSMKDSDGRYFDLEFEADGDLTMYDDHSNRLWHTNTGGHDCTKYCALRWTTYGRLEILVETQRGPQPIWSSYEFGGSDGRFLTFGATVPFIAVYTHNYSQVYSSSPANGDPSDILSLCSGGGVPCYNCWDDNCISGGNDGTGGSDIEGDPSNQPGLPSDG